MEAADSTSSSSKVIDLEARQPLGNLHWKSPTRPLRSIDKLNVSFIRETKENENSSANRRHQIPGLRQTPFVKIYLLRCDDKETYKEQSRKDIKQWMKTQGLNLDGKNSGKGQERHDAFEWMILHVVLPNTQAASLPKSAKHISIEATESTDSINSKSKWPGKTSSTIFDKLRADFSSSSKAPFERVAQVRIADNTKQNTTAAGIESQELWKDLVEKLKSAILGSFDARVAQYEDDIRDRESQRNLPGWNFCTFFVLKEGLARGFQNGGLLEDALIVYEELDADLDGVCREQAKSGDPDSAGALLPFSRDLKAEIRLALDSPSNGHGNGQNSSSTKFDLNSLFELERRAYPLDANKFDYQHRILTNQVSALDLRIYIFSRKLNIMYQKASNIASKHKSKSSDDGLLPKFDVSVVTDIVEQAVGFITFAARALRQDLYAAWGGQEGLSTTELRTQRAVIDNIVASWKISSMTQILEESQVSHILSENFIDTDQARNTNTNTRPQSQPNPISMQPAPDIYYIKEGEDSTAMDPTGSVATAIPQNSTARQSTARNHNYERLSLWTAELLIAARDVIASTNPHALPRSVTSMTTWSSDGSSTDPENTTTQGSGLRSASLQAASASTHICTTLYMTLSVHAYHCYITAKQTQASRQTLLNLAQLESMNSDLISAALWLEKISNLVEIDIRTVTDLSILTLYSRCLQNQERTSEYSTCLLSILQTSSFDPGGLALSSVNTDYQKVLVEFLLIADKVDKCELQASRLFRIGDVDKCIKQRNHEDGFVFTISLKLNIPAILEINEGIVLKLTSATSDDPSEIFMTSKTSVTLAANPTYVDFESNITTSGWYYIHSVTIILGNISFTHNFQTAVSKQDNIRQRTDDILWPILVYPRDGAISVEAKQSPIADLTRARHIRVSINAGDQDLNNISIKLKPCTAGARLDLSAMKQYDTQDLRTYNDLPVDQANAIEVSELTTGRELVFDVPYALEKLSMETLQLKIEMSYSTLQGNFLAYSSQTINIVLPIVVNLQDIFQYDRLFSRFTAAPSTFVPLTVTRWQIENDDAYEAIGGIDADPKVYAFPKLPISWIVEVLRREENINIDSRMPLLVQYQCLDEQILFVIGKQFLKDIRHSRINFACNLLQSHLLNKLPTLWNQSDLEAAALLQEISMWKYEQLYWKEVLQGLSSADRLEGETWLRQWHEDHKKIDLSDLQSRPPTEDISRTLRLSVDVPQPSLIISTELKLNPEMSTKDPHLGYITIGEPIQAELIILCKNNPREGDIEILYDIVSQAEAWIIGGKNRGVLGTSTETSHIPIILIPQRTGHIMYPSVEVRCRRTNDTSSYEDPARGSDAEDSLNLQYEVEYKSQAQSVLVISGVQGVTIALGSVMERGMGVGLGRDGYAIVDSRYRKF